MRFVKMEGLGNDFVVIDEQGGERVSIDPALARRLCDRRFGVGADQLLWLRAPHSGESDVRMEILNADGSVAEMCGNGIRAVGLYLSARGRFPAGRELRVETLAGLKRIWVAGQEITVDMGEPGFGPEFERGERLLAGGEEFRFHEVSMGNPHAVIFSAAPLATVALERVGPLIEAHPRFPKRTNVEFIQVESPTSIRARVWERGAGVTLACGTGACASAVAALALGRVSGAVDVWLPGGKLVISWEGRGKPVMMRGPAREVFSGEII